MGKTNGKHRDQNASPFHDESAGSDWSLLADVLDAVARDDREGFIRAFQALDARNPALAEEYCNVDDTMSSLQSGLTGPVDSSTEFGRIADQTKARLQAIRTGKADPQPPAAPSAPEESGVLTRLTTRLAPAEALELYRKIAPRLAVGILRRLDRSARLDTVVRVAEHLCLPEVQERLRTCEHVRDGIVNEFAMALRDGTVADHIDRANLLSIMKDEGILNDLTIMEKCIIVSRSVA